ncbi:hypothetical protein L210DRAFT_3561275 [Boletus edulis BED1]|uniref:F-box domain-containing protein n=1 Tax=Boletus edulis BED1 TaxID=1328754 RepID=A0AAD4BIE2_BOLED|nr:hypothetical protein L210DRAFT_3561275 [Boletus edulis BED1]
MGSQCILPPEVISHILSFLSPREVVRLRVISNQFYDITYDRAIWTSFYRNARLPRPPGPFPSQAIQFLDHTLVQSERLAHSWTTQPMEDISSVAIRTDIQILDFYAIVYGKWFIGCERFHTVKVVAYDLDSDAGSHPYQLLWEYDVPKGFCDACPVVSSSGLLIHVLFNEYTADGQSWKLLEFRVDGNSLHHTLTLDIPPKLLEFAGYMKIHGGHSPFFYLKSACQNLVFDAETRSFYGFPPFKSELTTIIEPTMFHVVLTKTHIISFFPFCTDPPEAPSTLVQAFTIPADSQLDNGIGILRLSHEGFIPNHDSVKNADLIRNSIVDAESGAINIRFLHQFFDDNVEDELHISCIDLTLPKHSSTDVVLPVTTDLQEIARVRVPHGSSANLERYVDFSDDGHVRGFYHFSRPRGGFRWWSANHFIMRFAIDASRDNCVADLGLILVPRWRQARNIWFDGVRGRVCYDRNFTEGADGLEAALVVNIK